MKSEKGKQVFVDDVDIVLTDKIIGHTRENADEKPAGPIHHSENQQGKNIGMKLGMKPSKTGFLKYVIGGAVIIAGLVAFFFVQKNMPLRQEKIMRAVKGGLCT